jgi:hypothetical protein
MAASSAAADCAATPGWQPAPTAGVRQALAAPLAAAGPQTIPTDPAGASALKVSAAPPVASPAAPLAPGPWSQTSLGVSLPITALVMLAIAWRRGSR